MDKKITSFSVDWHDCGLCNPLDKVHERTTIYLRKNIIRIEGFNGLNELLSKKEHFVIGDNLSDFFDFINKTDLNNEWKNDYSVRVCDGSIWEMRLRYNDRTVKLIKGNVCLPKNGRKIKKMIEDMLSIDKSIELPIIYGC